jgi:hypothetical protein
VHSWTKGSALADPAATSRLAQTIADASLAIGSFLRCFLAIPFLALLCEEKSRQNPRVKYWEIIADNLKKAGWSLGWISAFDRDGRTIWIADAHRYGKRFVARADEKLTAFLELESAIQARMAIATCHSARIRCAGGSR